MQPRYSGHFLGFTQCVFSHMYRNEKNVLKQEEQGFYSDFPRVFPSLIPDRQTAEKLPAVRDKCEQANFLIGYPEEFQKNVNICMCERGLHVASWNKSYRMCMHFTALYYGYSNTVTKWTALKFSPFPLTFLQNTSIIIASSLLMCYFHLFTYNIWSNLTTIIALMSFLKLHCLLFVYNHYGMI